MFAVESTKKGQNHVKVCLNSQSYICPLFSNYISSLIVEIINKNTEVISNVNRVTFCTFGKMEVRLSASNLTDTT